jgi:hypothetical protein
VRNAEFWRSRKNEFRRLAEYEYRAVPDPADRRRLYAYGDYTGVKSGATGSWKLRDGLSADFRSSFEEAATMAASGLKAPAGAEPLPFWLHSPAHFLEAQEQTREDRGHLGVWDPKRGGIIRDVPAASAFYCSWLAKERAAHEAATSISGTGNAPPPKRFPNRIARRATSEGTIEAVRLRAQQMIAEGTSHREVCLRLGNAPHPARTAWKHLPWDKAYKEPDFRGSVCKWLSKNCRP